MNIYTILDFWKKCSSDFVDTEYSFLSNLSSFLNELRQEQQNFNKNNFNIFSFISEVYRPDKNIYKKENPNSEILKSLLDPNTAEIGNPIVLKEFFEFIGLKEHKKFFPDLSKVKVEREKHHIDIYIHNDKNSVIIESKLYGARHQDFQLARYYSKSKEEGYNVKKIVYLTLDPIQELDLKDLYKPSKYKKYSPKEQKEFYSVVPEIQPLITYISAKNYDDMKSLSVFFDMCSKEQEIGNELLRIILEQYSKLLISLVGKQTMTSAEKNLISKIYESEESIKNAFEFTGIWKRKNDILQEIVVDKFKEKNKGWKNDESNKYFYKKVNGYKLFIAKKKWRIGFLSEKFKEAEREKLKNVLANLDIGDVEKKDDIHDDENQVYIDLIYNNEPINSYFNSVIQALRNLENDISQLN